MSLAGWESATPWSRPRGTGYWRAFSETDRRPPSADTLARVSALFDPRTSETSSRRRYARLKRNKALPAPGHGLIALVLDGHESNASYRRRCSGCLERKITTSSGPGPVLPPLRRRLARRGRLPSPARQEPQRAEDEVAPRPGSCSVCTSIPARSMWSWRTASTPAPRSCATVRALGKDLHVVLKREDWSLTQDVRALCERSSRRSRPSGPVGCAGT